MSDISSSKIGSFWSKRAPLNNEGNFYQSPITRPYIIETAFGKNYVDEYSSNSSFAIDIFISNYVKERKIESMLSLCCGFGLIEREFVSKLPEIKQCIGLDIAEGALENARKKANEEGLKNIEYKYADLNNYSFENEKYELVIANGALHHIKNLEGVIEGIYKTLKPGGILFATEFVGPSSQDYSMRQLQLINAVYYLLPKELRARKGLSFYKKKRLFRMISKMYAIANRKEKSGWPPWKKITAKVLRKFFCGNKNKFDFGVTYISQKDYLLRNDPSEGVRSAEIIPIIRSIFSKVEILPFNGGILQNILDENFFDNFDHNNIKHKRIFEVLSQLEKSFIEMGEISIDNAFIIAQK